MNHYMNAQIMNMKAMIKTFQQSCKMAATQDDGTISREEEKLLKKINIAAERFSKELENLQ